MLVPHMVKFLAREKERLAATGGDQSSISEDEEAGGIEVRPRGQLKKGDDDSDDEDDRNVVVVLDAPEVDRRERALSDSDRASVNKEGEDAATAKSYSASECSSP
jgi:hypothetical protein